LVGKIIEKLVEKTFENPKKMYRALKMNALG